MSFLNSCDHEAGSFMINKPESHIISDHVCVIKKRRASRSMRLAFFGREEGRREDRSVCRIFSVLI